MLDSLGEEARRAVESATQQARELGHGHVGTEHLLLGLMSDPEAPAARSLSHVGVIAESARAKIVESAGREDRLDEAATPALTARATRAIERASRFSRQDREPRVDTLHLLLGVLDVEGRAGQVLRGLGVDVTTLRADVEARRTGPTPSEGRLVSDEKVQERLRVRSPRCGGCGTNLEQVLAHRSMTSTDRGGSCEVVLVYCSACGTVLGVAPR